MAEDYEDHLDYLTRLIGGQETVMLCHDCAFGQTLPKVVLGGFVEGGKTLTFEEGVERTAVQQEMYQLVLFTLFVHAGHRLRITTISEAESRAIDSSFTSSDPSRDCRRNLCIPDMRIRQRTALPKFCNITNYVTISFPLVRNEADFIPYISARRATRAAPRTRGGPRCVRAKVCKSTGLRRSDTVDLSPH
jgi:hypothetical protein